MAKTLMILFSMYVIFIKVLNAHGNYSELEMCAVEHAKKENKQSNVCCKFQLGVEVLWPLQI